MLSGHGNGESYVCQLQNLAWIRPPLCLFPACQSARINPDSTCKFLLSEPERVSVVQQTLSQTCRCGPVVIQKYRQRISGPLLDRIDLHVEVPAVEYKTLPSTEQTEGSESIRQRVEKARAIQRERFAKEKGVLTNSHMTPRLIRKHCELDSEGAGFLEHAMTDQNFSARAHDRILKVARTLADLAGQEKISGNNVLEAINYRTLDRAMWS